MAVDKHIREAIKYAEQHGWRFEQAGPRAHAYGHLFAPDGITIVRVYGTPRSPENHAKHIRRQVDRLED